MTKLNVFLTLTFVSMGALADSLPRPLPRKVIHQKWSTDANSIQAIVYKILVQNIKECADLKNCPVQRVGIIGFKVGYAEHNTVQCTFGWVGRSMIKKFQCDIPEQLDATHLISSSAALLYEGLAAYHLNNPKGPVAPFEDADGYSIQTEGYQLNCSKKYLTRSTIEMYSCEHYSTIEE